jgi:hypothetical protein
MKAEQSIIDWTQNWFSNQNIIECTYDEFKTKVSAYVNANPTITASWKIFYNNLPINPKAIMYFPEWKYLNEFKLQNPINKQYDYFTNLEDANIQLEKNKKDFISQEKARFSVNAIINNQDESNTWTPVNPFTFDVEDDYQIFNCFTGQYTSYSNLQEAQQAQRQIEIQVGNLVPTIQQKLSSADEQETAWVFI